MITRTEIERLIENGNLKDEVELVWRLNCTAVPALLFNGLEGDNCRFGVVEHIIHTFFSTQTAKHMPGGAFAVFRKRFCASEQDVATALEQTRQDLETADVSDPDVAVTLIWLWLIEASKNGNYDVELKFFLYSLNKMVRGDQEVKQKGLKNLVESVAEEPSMFFRLLSVITGRHPQ